MIRRPPRSTLDRSSAASDVYKRQGLKDPFLSYYFRKPGMKSHLVRTRVINRSGKLLSSKPSRDSLHKGQNTIRARYDSNSSTELGNSKMKESKTERKPGDAEARKGQKQKGEPEQKQNNAHQNMFRAMAAKNKQGN
eukprot:TRINITY_DN6976_c0_g4_i3.p3 TRINITY_DN6976_c0_g4~~TRINITY_DN6976_c0_g4_i3.p3  ORF type:complete len:144 (-),score=54.95 TRINITY_DN6976_c0_g4_i3:178-588(-)